MDRFISIIHDLGIVCITHEDAVDLPIMLATRRAAGLRLREHGFHRLLIDVRRMPHPPQTLDTFEISSSHHLDLPSNVRVALLAAPSHHPNARFSENVSQNRGYNFQAFTSEAEALAWLTESP